MRLTDFDYELPENLIAQEPATPREASRMMIVNRAANTFRDDLFEVFPNCLSAGDVVVLNNTRVFPARLLGVSETGSKVEIFLVSKVADRLWEALARPARRLRTGKEVTFGELSGTVRDNLGDGRVLVEFTYAGEFQEILDRVGKTPLPPYIKRSAAAPDDDRDRYQTVYAKTSGAIAAPTAGLHFTDDVLERMRARGVEIVEITLHVGYGTFEPVRADDLSRHSVLPEKFEISELAAGTLNTARREHRRIVAVGTTTTRALESAVSKRLEFVPGSGTADLTITPGYEFRAVDALLTNFHLPRSSLLILVSTFGGHKLIMDAYKHAVTERYRFYSYGDCMFIE
jgi:S-adenosylmethionine:tRNA ribosyltransferase-isomerase